MKELVDRDRCGLAPIHATTPQSNITSVTSVADNLPGVSIQEGDAYGFDDWSSNVAVRGFQVTISEAQIGTTIDGFPNGTSDGASAINCCYPALISF